VALLAYIQRNQANTQVLTAMRIRIRDTTMPPLASASDPVSSIQPGKPIRAARIPACSCKSPATIRPISTFPAILQLRRGEGGAERAAISRSWWNAAGALCASTCETSTRG